MQGVAEKSVPKEERPAAPAAVESDYSGAVPQGRGSYQQAVVRQPSLPSSESSASDEEARATIIKSSANRSAEIDVSPERERDYEFVDTAACGPQKQREAFSPPKKECHIVRRTRCVGATLHIHFLRLLLVFTLH